MAGSVLVVAQYKEDLSWLDDVEGFDPYVVTKGYQLPNKGREASSFFYAMAELLDSKYDKFGFLQGNPFAHCFLGELTPIEGFRWLGIHNYESFWNGAPWHPGLEVAKKHQEWFGKWGQKWPGRVTFAAGGQFVLTRKELERYNSSFYTKMQEEMYEDQNPWVMERLWGAMFQ